jgi:hypothetical protein
MSKNRQSIGYKKGYPCFLTKIKGRNELPRGRAIEVSIGRELIFSFMKTSGFQTFLFTPRQSLEELID